MKKTVAVIILNYNLEEHIKKCLASLFANDWKSWGLIVGDNESPNNKFYVVEEYLAKNPAAKKLLFCETVRNGANFGFAGGVNRLIKKALPFRPDFVFLLNPDTTVQPDFLKKLITCAQEFSEFGILSPLVRDFEGDIWFSGGSLRWLRQRAVHFAGDPLEKLSETEFASGCSMLIRADLFEKVGFFDEKYFLYYEDADFCWRARAAGCKIGVVKDSVIFHNESASMESETKLYNLVFGGLIFFKRYTPFPKNFLFWPIFWLRRLKAELELVFYPRNRKATIVQRAFKDFYENHSTNRKL